MEYDLPPSAEEQAFLAHIIADPADDLRRLVFADWLEDNSQDQRAAYIRARCALDGKRPEFGTYADAIEQLAACRYQRPNLELPPGFSFRPHVGGREDWWDDSEDTMEGGMPSVACIDPGAIEDVGSDHLLAAGMQTLVETTTIRGLKTANNYCVRAPVLFASPSASAITRLELQYYYERDSACPAVVALAASPIARTLTRLGLYHGVPNQATANVLAAAPFDSLRRFETGLMPAAAKVYRRLMAAPWFGRLERLVTPVPPGTVGQVRLPHLHTLGIRSPARGLVEAFARSAELPALRRLIISATDLRASTATSLAALRCGELVELLLRRVDMRQVELKVLLAAPWARRLEVLTIKTHNSAAPFNKVIDKSPCAKTLRIRRVGNVG